jgi:acyl-CoA thioester hydrolase
MEMDDQAWDKAAAGERTTVRVRVADTDLMGVVYHANYLVWFEIGRTELIRACGLSYADVEKRGLSLPVIEARFKVRRPARYDDLVKIEARMGELRSRRVDFLYRLTASEELLVEGTTVHVPLDHAAGRAVSMPDWLLAPLRSGPGPNPELRRREMIPPRPSSSLAYQENASCDCSGSLAPAGAERDFAGGVPRSADPRRRPCRFDPL